MITAVGPYQLYGEPLVASCAAAGTDYLDLSGEVAWMRSMIDRYDAKARASGARILFSCGFDSIPFELGVLFLQHQARERWGAVAPRILGRITAMQGGYSGGTIAAGAATMAAVEKDPAVSTLLRDPFALTPGFKGAEQAADEQSPVFDEVLQQWTAPFVMAPINTRNVHRSNVLQNGAYGRDFRYDERLVTGSGESGHQAAERVVNALEHPEDVDWPKPSEGPSKVEREAGHYEVLFVGLLEDGRRIDVRVRGNRDPGYDSTCRIIAETAVLLRQVGEGIAGGIWTPGAALGLPLVHRLDARAGLTFTPA